MSSHHLTQEIEVSTGTAKCVFLSFPASLPLVEVFHLGFWHMKKRQTMEKIMQANGYYFYFFSFISFLFLAFNFKIIQGIKKV